MRLETSDMLLRADELDYNTETGDAEARGHVHFEHFVRGEKLDCERAEYNVDTETGKFYEVSGTANARIQARRGLLVTQNPFYFQGKWAERLQDHYILHDGFLTDCVLPGAWWRLKGADLRNRSRRSCHLAQLLVLSQGHAARLLPLLL